MISMDKQYRTRDGREVRIYAVDGGEAEPVHGAILDENENWITYAWNLNGAAIINKMTAFDLIEVKPRIKREYWVNVYPLIYRPDITIHPSENEAEEKASGALIACVKITIDCEEGEGL